jgi:hypothetical protein
LGFFAQVGMKIFLLAAWLKIFLLAAWLKIFLLEAGDENIFTRSRGTGILRKPAHM